MISGVDLVVAVAVLTQCLVEVLEVPDRVGQFGWLVGLCQFRARSVRSEVWAAWMKVRSAS